ncbi:class I SAM-dependent methyltransferase [Subsaxibacter sp. CAU 1640]|uniref:class I SAM-dependent methyltransferase n=1 Tax=Subsaxibacter sp. CAU 1640 TaxID=2933271 RepID=UPI0020062FAE|nr:class I SAM-dependent methyltransferase [Subsaxibacter sp. CAU 1640]MCK7589889.1 class I SAM-dependent methyltransferase [Subsaxibacter sp. CAU 1640]
MSQSSLFKIKQSLSNLFKTSKEKRHSLVGAGNLWQMKRDFQIKFLMSQGLKPSDKLMDIGCGTLRGGIPIIDYLDVSNYYGIEVRKGVLEEGIKELKASNLLHKMPKLIHFNHFDEIKADDEIDVMFAFSVLIHLNDTIVDACFQMASKLLSEDGKFYANVNIGSNKEGQWQGFPVVFRTLEFYRNLAYKYGLSLEVLGSLKDLGHITGKKSDEQQIMLKFSRHGLT